MKYFSTILPLITAALLFTSCHSNSSEQSGKKRFGQKQRDIVELYNIADSVYHFGGHADTALFGRFIRKAVDFAKAYPKDEISAEMLYRAGVGSMILAKSAIDRAQTAQYAKQAIAIFNQYQEQYPKGDKAEFCFYQRGIIYDDILGDTRSAENEFRDYINRNPGDSLSAQLEQYIKLLGKNEGEIEEALGLK
ncbi:MAG: hypothetical protein J5730_05860 [Bacteroidales bacterium]|nr:hypothetical protein [Bacteroidales bacterium]